jgi:uncharacterized membrane protein YhhN
MNRISDKKNRIVALLIVGLCIAYLLTLEVRPYALSYLVKSLPIFLLSLLVWFNTQTPRGRLTALGLVFSGIGDVILALDFQNLFVAGIISFTIAHLCYISAFLRGIRLSRSSLTIMLGLLLYAAIMGQALFPHLGNMAIPVFFYLGIIILMAASAALGENNHKLLLTGAILFIISDSLIAVDQFVSPIPYSNHWVMISYYLAQILIAMGAFRTFQLMTDSR